MERSEPLAGGVFSGAVRRGGVVERDVSPANVRALLGHLERVGFGLSPRVVGVDGGREQLGYLPGEAAVYPLPEAVRSDAALRSVGRAVRELHDAAAGFAAPDPDGWGRGHDRAMPVRADCIGHHDLAPWNLLFGGPDGTDVLGIVDFDFAGPSTRAWDLAYAACRFVPLADRPHRAAFGWPEGFTEAEAGRRLQLFVDAYNGGGPPLVGAAELVDLAILRLASIAAHIEERIRAGDPAFALQQRERHAAGYRSDAAHLIRHREELLP